MFPFRRKIPGFSVAPFLFSSAFLALAQESVTISLFPPVPFGPDDKASCVSLREDGALVAFQSRRPDGRGGADIWLSRFQNGKWSEPDNAGPGVNTSANEVDAKLSTDGKTTAFIRGQNFKESSGIYISRFRNGAWSEGELVGPPVTLPHTIQFGAVLTRDGKRLYLRAIAAVATAAWTIITVTGTAPNGRSQPISVRSSIRRAMTATWDQPRRKNANLSQPRERFGQWIN